MNVMRSTNVNVTLSKIEYGVCGDLIIILSTSIFYLLKGGYRFEGVGQKSSLNPQQPAGELYPKDARGWKLIGPAPIPGPPLYH